MSNDEILREFLLETQENLSLLDADLIALEKNPTEKSTLAQVFRTLHSVKGTAGFMGLEKLQAVTHSAESLLTRLRAGELLFNPPIATALLRVVDAVREMLSNIEASGGEGTGDYSALTAEVDRLRETGGAKGAIPTPDDHAGMVEQTIEFTQSVPIPSPPSLAIESPTVELPPSATVSAVTLETAIGEVSEIRAGSIAESSIRVDVGLLDKVMTLVSELVLARNQILPYSELQEDSGFLGAVQRLNLLTTELQANVMKTRMQPIGNVLNKFPRVVRDLALACGKSVRFEMDGQETELDRTLIEAIRDPLTHLVRNAIDHGIEPSAIRRSLGKPEEGRLRMVAFHEGGKVVIEITDDGGGINVARVQEKAIDAKLVSAGIAARMSQQEILRLIFLPGFSTADHVTQFSGRGVGMDVVLTNIEKIGGTVEIESTLGQGTTVRTKIPLTLTIIPALIVVSGGELYAIPQVSLLELVRLDGGQTSLGVERMHGAPVYRLRGALLPLVFLDDQLGIATHEALTPDLNIVVLQADGRPFGMVVDTIRDTEEIVVKPLQKQLKGISVFAGAAIMGDGRVALVLDVVGMAQRAGVISRAKSRLPDESEPSPQFDEIATEPLLLFAPSAGGQMAIPLPLVARLEEFSRAEIEIIGTQQVVQYRGEILPLIDVSQELDPSRRRGSIARSPTSQNVEGDDFAEAIPVIVYASKEQRIGLIVGKVLDIVHDNIVTRTHATRPGVLFTAVVQEKVTEIIDVATLVRDAPFDLLHSAK